MVASGDVFCIPLNKYEGNTLLSILPAIALFTYHPTDSDGSWCVCEVPINKIRLYFNDFSVNSPFATCILYFSPVTVSVKIFDDFASLFISTLTDVCRASTEAWVARFVSNSTTLYWNVVNWFVATNTPSIVLLAYT